MAKCQHPPDNRYPDACSRKAGTIAEGSPCNEIRKEMIDGLRIEMEALQDEWFVLLLPCDGRMGLVPPWHWTAPFHCSVHHYSECVRCYNGVLRHHVTLARDDASE